MNQQSNSQNQSTESTITMSLTQQSLASLNADETTPITQQPPKVVAKKKRGRPAKTPKLVVDEVVSNAEVDVPMPSSPALSTKSSHSTTSSVESATPCNTKFLKQLGATQEELLKYQSYADDGEWKKIDQRGLDILQAFKQDQTATGGRTERCSFQFKLQVSKKMLKTIQHRVLPRDNLNSKTYTDVAIKTALNQYFYSKFNSLMAMELAGLEEEIYSKKKGEEDKVLDTIIDAPEGYFSHDFCDGFLMKTEGREILDKHQEIHEAQLNRKRKTKNKKSQKEEATSFLDSMTKEERDEFLAKYMMKQ